MHWVAEAREHVYKILSEFPDAAKETAAELLSEELKKIPVPVIGTILSKAVKQATKSKDTGGPGIKDVIQMLQQMQASDDDFLQGLSTIGEDIDRLDALIQSVKAEIEAAKRELTTPKPIISEPNYVPKYPQADNELYFGLMNIGGGAIKVPEIHLIVESWEPEIIVDYTVPAAPPLFLRIKVRLSPDVSQYALLKLNNEPFRRFGPHSEGAEDVCIQMSSETNARYRVRIHVPYTDMATGQAGELIYPAPDQNPLETSFCYAPGWNSSITPANMLARQEILTEIISTFNKATQILEQATPSDNMEQRDLIDERLREIGFFMGVGFMPQVLSRFIPPLTEIARIENRSDVVGIILKLAHQTMRYIDMPIDQFAVDALCESTGRAETSKQIRRFFTEHDEANRQKYLAEIIR